jgi:phage terminase large subunit-like protein
MAKSIMEIISELPPELQKEALAGVDMDSLVWDWSMWGRPEQIPPNDNSWDVGLFMAGRGAGKTRSAAEWIRMKARDTSQGPLRFLLVARTAADVREVLIEGEALALDTPVATPTGFTAINDLQPGDTVLGGNGLPCTVTKVHPVLYDRPTYAVNVSGTTVIADANHKWATSTQVQRMYSRRRPHNTYEAVNTTEEILASLKTAGWSGQSNHGISISPVVGQHDSTLPVQPYTLGLWLGDGTAKSNSITSHDDDQPFVRSRIESEGYTTTDQNTRFSFGVLTLTTAIKAAGVYKNKHIPEQYFHSSLDQRMALLNGLIDSDGHVSERGQIEFTNTNHRLATDVSRLLASLGIKNNVTLTLGGRVFGDNNYVSSDIYRVRFTTSLPVASLPRKAERIKSFSPEESWRHIKSVSSVDTVPVRCIEVDSPDHTFLITDQYIRTHNSGIMAVSPESERPDYRPSIRRLIWPNGNQAFCTSADEPDSLRGVQAHYSWGDEVAAWRLTPDGAGMTAWDNLRVATRLGRIPQVLATTTPKRVKILFDLLDEHKAGGRVWVTTGSTFDNAGNLSGAYLTAIKGVYEGTDQAKQELYGEMLAEAAGALWTDEMINEFRVKSLPPYTPLRVIGVDPSVAENPGDECGIVVVGSTNEQDLYKRHAWVMEDASLKGAPHVWAAEVVRMANKWGCPVVAEVNQGGALVANAIHQLDPSVVVLEVHSKVGKKLRAEPITLAYQQGRVHHVPSLRGIQKGLEDQMVGWLPEGSTSPDRVDALVHALTALLISPPSGYSGGLIRASNPLGGAGRRVKTRTSPTAMILSGRSRIQKGNTGAGFRFR